jgi:aromatic ring-opening dioxygenase catalytic subunit (LigB family)
MPLLGDVGHRELTQFMQQLAQDLPRPKAILVISAHWEETDAHISSAANPAMLFDYSGFPPESYQFHYPAPGYPLLAEHIAQLLREKNITSVLDKQRGYDHGTFVPLMLSYPAADIPVVQLSLLNSLDPAAHIALGNAIAPLREQGVLILGSGMSFHNMRAFFSPSPTVKIKSDIFDHWLHQILTSETMDYPGRTTHLINWTKAAEARFCHPREEHLLPLHVCFGSAQKSLKAQRNFGGYLLGAKVSGYIWR